MSLHLVFNSRGLTACLTRANDSDDIILLGDAVYTLNTHSPTRPIYVLQEDVTLRGLATPESATSIDYSAMVELCTRQHPIVSWRD